MTYQISLSQEELQTVRQVLEEELEAVHTELRRTRNMDFKEQVRHRMESISQALHAMEQAAGSSQAGQYTPA
jgi:ABC-type phosphate transport system auxiliary subunit